MKPAIRVPLVLFALALLLVPLAAGDQGQITLPRGEHVTVLTLDLHRSDIIDYSWSANSSVTFRVENVTGANTFVDRAGQSGSGSWQAMADGTYTFEFRNTLDLAATVQWNIAIRPVLAATYVYLLLAGAVAAVVFTTFYIRRKKPVN